MCSISNKLDAEIKNNHTSRKEFCKKYNFDEGNMCKTLKKSDIAFINKELIKCANALGYDVKLILVDKVTGKQI